MSIPDTEEVFLYPLIRKPSVICSNTFIIATPSLFIIIDPGTDTEQIKQIRQAILSKKQGLTRQVYLFLTHCHIDHFLAINQLMDKTIDGKLICHPIAADAIEKRDESITLADMNGSILPVCEIRMRFPESDKKTTDTKTSPLWIEKDTIEPDKDCIIHRFRIKIGDKDWLEAFHTPGHSPDSLCYSIGRFAFTGDIHLATNPGIAGKAGWNNKDLGRSLKAMIELVKQYGITYIFPGHGNPIAFEKAIKVLSDAYNDAGRLDDIIPFNRDRSIYMSEYATVLLEEAGSIFSIIAARLMKISYYLDMLGEEESGEAILNIISYDTIDEIIGEFHDYIKELKVKQGAPVISKAVQFVRKVNKIFEPEKIAALFDPYFIRRIRSLLSEFVNVVYGISFTEQQTIFNLNYAVKETLDSIKKGLIDDERIYNTLDDNKDFVDELTRRIAFTPLFSSVNFVFNPSDKDIYVTADKSMFQDMLTALLEQIAISCDAGIFLKTDSSKEEATLTVTTDKEYFILRDLKILYLQHSMKIGGGEFKKTASEGKDLYKFIFPNKIG